MILRRDPLALAFLLLLLCNSCCFAFLTPNQLFVRIHVTRLSASTSSQDTTTESSTTTTTTSSTGDYAPRTGVGQALLNWALETPVWKYLLVPQARNTMVKTAEANGIEWTRAKEWIASQVEEDVLEDTTMEYPDYYRQGAFHAYASGNLCWDAAMEQEIASCAVGARNFPAFRQDGETAFRAGFVQGLKQAGATVPAEPVGAVDLGCGTGLSSRQLATTKFPISGNTNGELRTVDQVIGMDLSPYYISVGKTLLEKGPFAKMTDETTTTTNNPVAWVNPITPDMQQKVKLQVADAADTGLPDNSVDIVQVLFVLHELPSEMAVKVIAEAHRILKPGTGQLWMGEMDFQSRAYAAQRANPLLFSLLRATEPYLDDYADGFATHIQPCLARLFDKVVYTAATGRHYAVVANKGSGGNDNDNRKAVVEDYRFLPNGDYAIEDTHLQLWESEESGKDG